MASPRMGSMRYGDAGLTSRATSSLNSPAQLIKRSAASWSIAPSGLRASKIRASARLSTAQSSAPVTKTAPAASAFACRLRTRDVGSMTPDSLANRASWHSALGSRAAASSRSMIRVGAPLMAAPLVVHLQHLAVGFAVANYQFAALEMGHPVGPAIVIKHGRAFGAEGGLEGPGLAVIVDARVDHPGVARRLVLAPADTGVFSPAP